MATIRKSPRATNRSETSPSPRGPQTATLRGMVLNAATRYPVAQVAVTASPLNALVNAPVDQMFTIAIDKAAHPGVDFSSIVDVVLGVEYTADVT